MPNPPNIAVCIGGSARTFTRKLVHQALRDSVLRSFGAPTTRALCAKGARARACTETSLSLAVFAVIKTHDARGDERPEFGGTVDGDPEAVVRALEWLGVPPSRYRVSGLDQPSHSEPPRCENYPKDFKAAADSPTTQIGTVAHRASTTGQVESRYKCHELIAEHERSTGVRFDWVLFARPDLFWFRPVFPWCHIEEAVVLGAKRSDWTFMVTRDEATRTMRTPYELYFNCSAPFLLTDNQEAWEDRHVWPGPGGKAVHDQQGLLPAYLVRDGTRAATPMFSCGEIDFYAFGASLNRQQFPVPKWYESHECRILADINTCNLESA